MKLIDAFQDEHVLIDQVLGSLRTYVDTDSSTGLRTRMTADGSPRSSPSSPATFITIGRRACSSTRW